MTPTKKSPGRKNANALHEIIKLKEAEIDMLKLENREKNKLIEKLMQEIHDDRRKLEVCRMFLFFCHASLQF